MVVDGAGKIATMYFRDTLTTEDVDRAGRPPRRPTSMP